MVGSRFECKISKKMLRKFPNFRGPPPPKKEQTRRQHDASQLADTEVKQYPRWGLIKICTCGAKSRAGTTLLDLARSFIAKHTHTHTHTHTHKLSKNGTTKNTTQTHTNTHTRWHTFLWILSILFSTQVHFLIRALTSSVFRGTPTSGEKDKDNIVLEHSAFSLSSERPPFTLSFLPLFPEKSVCLAYFNKNISENKYSIEVSVWKKPLKNWIPKVCDHFPLSECLNFSTETSHTMVHHHIVFHKEEEWSWNTASGKCRHIKGYLPTTRTREELDNLVNFIENLHRINFVDFIFVGIDSQVRSDEFNVVFGVLTNVFQYCVV